MREEACDVRDEIHTQLLITAGECLAGQAWELVSAPQDEPVRLHQVPVQLDAQPHIEDSPIQVTQKV